MNAQEATEKINGKPLLAEGIADSVADLKQKAALKGNLVSLGPTGFEQLAFWITSLAPLLLLVGILGAYLEFKIPGATMPGIISAACFALFFLGHYLAGLAGSGRALELAVGTGRVALPLAARGVPMSGVELSPDMLERLRAKPGGDAVDAVEGDLTTTRVPGTSGCRGSASTR